MRTTSMNCHGVTGLRITEVQEIQTTFFQRIYILMGDSEHEVTVFLERKEDALPQFPVPTLADEPPWPRDEDMEHEDNGNWGM